LSAVGAFATPAFVRTLRTRVVPWWHGIATALKPRERCVKYGGRGFAVPALPPLNDGVPAESAAAQVAAVAAAATARVVAAAKAICATGPAAAINTVRYSEFAVTGGGATTVVDVSAAGRLLDPLSRKRSRDANDGGAKQAVQTVLDAVLLAWSTTALSSRRGDWTEYGDGDATPAASALGAVGYNPHFMYETPVDTGAVAQWFVNPEKRNFTAYVPETAAATLAALRDAARRTGTAFTDEQRLGKATADGARSYKVKWALAAGARVIHTVDGRFDRVTDAITEVPAGSTVRLLAVPVVKSQFYASQSLMAHTVIVAETTGAA
jgi:hypothetical protein